MAITAVTFDLWQTLLVEDPVLGRQRAQLRIDGVDAALRAAGRSFSQERLWEAYWACAADCAVLRSRGRDRSFGEQVELFIEKIDQGLSRELPEGTVAEVGQRYDGAFLEYPPPLDSDAKDVLASLRDRGYRLGMVSNTGMTPGTTFRAYMEERGILGFFDVLIFSDEVGLSKPTAEIFHWALKALGVSPAEAVHVGDDILRDVAGAQGAGLRAIWLSADGEVKEGSGAKPDVIVRGLGQVPQAVEKLAGETAQG